MRRLLFMIFALFMHVGCNDKSSDSKDIAENIDVKRALFSKLSSDKTGIDFVNVNEDNDVHNVYKYAYYYNGGGVAIADLNNDGLQDIVFTSNMEDNKVYLNKGDFKFQDISETSGINSEIQGWNTGVTTLDINGDGFEDIFVCRSGFYEDKDKAKVTNLLYINNGNLTFTESAAEYGLDGFYYSMQACFFDFDNDGDLDLYLLNHPNVFKEIQSGKNNTLLPDLPNESKFSDQFFVNESNKFVNKTKEFGLENRAHGLGVVAFDYNNDGYRDLFVSNDFKMPNIVLLNKEGKGFENTTETSLKHMAKFSMGCDFGDVNNDGFQDIVSVEMLAANNFRKKTNMMPMNTKIYWEYVNKGKQYQDMHNCLQLNNTNGTFSEIAWLSKIAETDWSWSPILADFDNDGFQDLYVTNGFKRDIHFKDFVGSKEMKEAKKQKSYSFESLTQKLPSTKTSNYMFGNNGDLTFSDKTNDWGLFDPMFSYGSAYVDLNNDGNLDLVVNNMNDKAQIYKNNGTGNNYLKVYLKKGANYAYGSKVELYVTDLYQAKELANVHGYLSKSEDVLHFGISDKKKIDSLKITWYDQKITMLYDVKVNENLTVDYEKSDFNSLNSKNIKSLFFETANLNFNVNYVHREAEYDDYLKEILLPHKLSQEGPHIDVADVNNDGLDDFYVGNGSGFAGELYVQQVDATFLKMNQPAFIADKSYEDYGVLFFDYDNDGDKDLYVVSGSNEVPLDSKYMNDRLYANDGKGHFTRTKDVIPNIAASGSVARSEDIDGDGDLDLFIGGYLVPQKYPMAGKSTILMNENGSFIDRTATFSTGLENIGMVKDAAFTDINGDGKMDLIVVGHWMPVSVFINVDGSLENQSEKYGLNNTVGWWNTIYLDDFNKDGKMDFAAGNLGLNSKHKASEKGTFKVIAKDFDNNGTNDIALAYYENGSFYPVRGRECSSQQVPDIKKNFKSYTEFGNASFDDLYNYYDLSDAIKLEAQMFESSIFINEGNKFKIQSLPNDCQFAPTNGICGVDMDNDGQKELVMVGNFYPVEIETGRYDAHIGNVVSVNTDGSMKSIPFAKSGFFANGDARSMKEIIIGGNAYLMVTNNRNKIKFIRENSLSMINENQIQ
ncbi:VCBS repeat-containing protein [Ulvibacter antarcticus]|uniref:VCBS repeat protein n=1 Tax=Ulvibacter antarcticus TaxID=442714 RepID=A0A3L9YYM6_9FLAO|nr:VCBS repeat-containing protein [Ulvibacter antarcticus]RMA64940.1 VCBS repeat protein [Ulvibacter antarcticus]